MTTTSSYRGDAESGISALADYTKEQLVIEDARKTSFEQRGLAVVTTSGALVTLLFGLTALSTRAQSHFTLPGAAKPALAVALGFFVCAAIAALLTNAPINYEWADPSDLRTALKASPVMDEQTALKNVGLTRIKVLDVARSKNQFKGRALIAAIALEVLAVAAVATAVAIVIL
jgi:hypothetical protein